MAGFRYLLDTNILSALIKQPAGALAQRVVALNGTDFCTSIVVACELRYGVQKKGSPILATKVDELLENITVLPLDADVDHRYAGLRIALESNGQPIGPNDMLIAAHALALGLILVTDNTREFCRVPGLTVENWLATTSDAPVPP